MKEIPLTQGKVALVDDEDYERVSQYKWFAHKQRGGAFYAGRNGSSNKANRQTQQMHRFIMNAVKGQQVDHINGDGLDNRRSNLRFCSTSQNQQNKRRHCRNKSGYKGVGQNKYSGRWAATIKANSKTYHLGTFASKEEAARAYNEAAIKFHGEFAHLNEVPA